MFERVWDKGADLQRPFRVEVAVEWTLVPDHSLNTTPRPTHTLYCGVRGGGHSGALESRTDEMQVSIFHSNRPGSRVTGGWGTQGPAQSL